MGFNWSKKDLSKANEKLEETPKKIQSKITNFFRKLYLSLRRITNHVGGISLGHFRSRDSIFWSIIYPCILIIIFGAIFGRSITPNFYTLDVLDWNDSSDSREFISYLDNLTNLEINVIEETVVIPSNWLSENNKPILLIIPALWDLHLQMELASNITVHYDASSTSARNILEIIEEAVIEFNLEILPIDIKFGVKIENYFVNELKFIDSFVPGIIIVSISTLALFTGLSYDLNEKQSGILYRLSTTPTKRFEWIISKQIWQLLLATIASSLCILFALIYDFNASSLKPMMILFVIFGTMTFSGLALILIRLISNPDGVMLISVLISIPQILLSGALLPLDTFPSFLRNVARIFPMFYLTEGMRFLMLDYTRIQFWQYFSISAAFAFLLFIIGILLTKWRKD
ncbi:MAG: ABC transporter permease [Asgard group archaeon]|nr:ABC transporter permease [Asgard group archaeon]